MYYSSRESALPLSQVDASALYMETESEVYWDPTKSGREAIDFHFVHIELGKRLTVEMLGAANNKGVPLYDCPGVVNEVIFYQWQQSEAIFASTEHFRKACCRLVRCRSKSYHRNVKRQKLPKAETGLRQAFEDIEQVESPLTQGEVEKNEISIELRFDPTFIEEFREAITNEKTPYMFAELYQRALDAELTAVFSEAVNSDRSIHVAAAKRLTVASQKRIYDYKALRKRAKRMLEREWPHSSDHLHPNANMQKKIIDAIREWSHRNRGEF